jgi:hypothetical protein
MAYDFVAASNQYLVTSSAPVTGTPLTMACWAVKDTGGPTARCLLSLGNSTDGNVRFNILSNDSFLVLAAVTNSAGTGGSSQTGTPATGTSFHAAGVFSSSVFRLAYANGVAGTANTNNVTPTGIDRIGIGARVRSGIDLYHDGLIAEVGIWDAALTAAEIASLAAGVTCDKVRPQSLRFYAPLIRDLQDVRDGLTITNTNSATVADHPRVYK